MSTPELIRAVGEWVKDNLGSAAFARAESVTILLGRNTVELPMVPPDELPKVG